MLLFILPVQKILYTHMASRSGSFLKKVSRCLISILEYNKSTYAAETRKKKFSCSFMSFWYFSKKHHQKRSLVIYDFNLTIIYEYLFYNAFNLIFYMDHIFERVTINLPIQKSLVMRLMKINRMLSYLLFCYHNYFLWHTSLFNIMIDFKTFVFVSSMLISCGRWIFSILLAGKYW